ncbi:7-cyano-7-deazaguanine synthase QueC [bacterium]|nr:7-cyano-7-deazaguanine synthase QueC [bacterium]
MIGKKDSIVLLSAGLDSTVNLYAAMQETNVKLAITFNYGQKAAAKEIECAKFLAEGHKIPHIVVELPWLKDLGQSSLTKENAAVPTGKKISIDNDKVSLETARAVWVPNRNGVFLNVAASYAESMRAEIIVPGFNREEAATFPDNSLDFIRSTRKAFIYSTATGVDVQCYTITMGKSEIVELGKKLKVPFEKIWPCYQAKDLWCGECESCQRAIRAFRVGRLDLRHLFEKY